MRIATRYGAAGALIAFATLAIAACLLQGTAISIATAEEGTGPQFLLSKPDGDGPFPAVVLTHGCGGTERNTQHQTVWRGLLQHAKLLKRNGYVTMIIDSFHRRGITDGCQHPLSYYPVQVRDAYAAFDRLAAMPLVDENRIGYVGQSLGGGTALRLAQGGYINARTRKGLGTFAALVAYYPWCESSWAHSLVRPVLILVGGKDDWTPADRCRDLHEIAKQVSHKPVLMLKVYPRAHHSFDLPMQGPYYVKGDGGKMHTVQGDTGARNDSQRRMIAFFDKYLGPEL